MIMSCGHSLCPTLAAPAEQIVLALAPIARGPASDMASAIPDAEARLDAAIVAIRERRFDDSESSLFALLAEVESHLPEGEEGKPDAPADLRLLKARVVSAGRAGCRAPDFLRQPCRPLACRRQHALDLAAAGLGDALVLL